MLVTRDDSFSLKLETFDKPERTINFNPDQISILSDLIIPSSEDHLYKMNHGFIELKNGDTYWMNEKNYLLLKECLDYYDLKIYG